MTSDLIAYTPLVIVFVVTALRMFVEKPNRANRISLRPWRDMLRRPHRGGEF